MEKILIVCLAMVCVAFLNSVHSSPSTLDYDFMVQTQPTSKRPEPEIVQEIIVKNSTSALEGPSTTSSTSGATCSCSNNEDPICASNGVTYKNTCRFECTKKRVKRLRIVKTGKCNGLSLSAFRSGPNQRQRYY